MLEFAELARIRAQVRESTLGHVRSLEYFKSNWHSSFYKTVDEVLEGKPPADNRLHRITTTLTCAESLSRAGDAGRVVADEIVSSFALWALNRPPRQWESEGAAMVYCRVRALAPLRTLVSSLSDNHVAKATLLLDQAWHRVALDRGRDGVFEYDVTKPDATGSQYPPNAYLTYFGLAALSGWEDRIEGGREKTQMAVSWLEKCLGFQVALHFQGSSIADPQQLAWSMAGLVRFRRDDIVNQIPSSISLLEAGLRAFFDQQVGGSWPRGEPLFHYPEAGNAYCYAFETLGELVELAVGEDDVSRTLRRLLEPYQDKLAASLQFIEMTKRPLHPGSNLYGWGSGHHPHRATPESWATACVYRFLQAARRLFGIWARDESARLLGARQAKGDLDFLEGRGDTWDTGRGSVGSQLATLFIHPIAAHLLDQPSYDPDEAILRADGARSAMMFGPPGTGKTTLAETVAGCLGWQFVEITPASFLDDGVEHVSSRADAVFKQIMELDRCVVLFDEIDELIRIRNNQSEPLERFFTTTMLPLLSKLWDQRKVVFFVNTNGIDVVDPAIRRSSRFDAAIFVPTGSFERKMQELLKTGAPITAPREKVDALLKGGATDIPDDEHELVWFAFLRHDQLGRLAGRYRTTFGDAQPSDSQLATLLSEFGRDLQAADWLDPEKTRSAMSTEVVLTRYRTLLQDQRLDGKDRVARLHTALSSTPIGVEILRQPNGATPGYARLDVAADDLQAWATGEGLTLDSAGVLT